MNSTLPTPSAYNTESQKSSMQVKFTAQSL